MYSHIFTVLILFICLVYVYILIYDDNVLNKHSIHSYKPWPSDSGRSSSLPDHLPCSVAVPVSSVKWQNY